MASPVLADPSKKAKGGTFRIVAGSHIGDGPKGCQCTACINSGGKNHVYEAYDPRRHPATGYDNDIIETSHDLTKFNQRFSRKFERVEADHPPARAAEFPLDKMTVPQLLAVADEEKVDLKGTGKKDDIIKLIRESRTKS